MSAVDAVLLDVGGVFLVPEHDRIVGAFTRAECKVDAEILDRAHYVAATAFTTDLDVEGDWAGSWEKYLDAYIVECGVDEDYREEAHRHLDSEFAEAGLWLRVLPGAKDGLEALATTDVKLGVISNADGQMARRLRELEILQVGEGPGIEVGCFVDSGEVGIMKPDPRIFEIALDELGVAAERAWYVGDMPGIDVVGARRARMRPFIMDPLGLHHDADYDRTDSLGALARLITA
jgi:FMN phosphatase YigB (HAD superfamily)